MVRIEQHVSTTLFAFGSNVSLGGGCSRGVPRCRLRWAGKQCSNGKKRIASSQNAAVFIPHDCQGRRRNKHATKTTSDGEKAKYYRSTLRASQGCRDRRAATHAAQIVVANPSIMEAAPSLCAYLCRLHSGAPTLRRNAMFWSMFVCGFFGWMTAHARGVLPSLWECT